LNKTDRLYKDIYLLICW